MRVAVVDDEKIWREEISRICKKYLNNEIQNLDLYDAGEDFVSKNALYDLVFMDVKLGEEDGIDLIEKMKRQGDMSICFVSSHLEDSRRGYKVNAFRYIDKACLEEEIKEAIEARLRSRENAIDQTVIRVGNSIISMDEIMFVEVLNRHVILHTINRQYKMKLTLEEVEDVLEGKQFFRAHKSCIVNLKKIADIKNDEIFMENGEKAFCSVRKKKELLSKWIDCRIG